MSSSTSSTSSTPRPRTLDKMIDPAELLRPLTEAATATPDAVDAAVQGFKALAEAAGSDQTALADRVWDADCAIFVAAGVTPPEDQGPLVEFVVRLRNTTATDPDGKPLRCDDVHGAEAGQVWTDLPSLGWVARDNTNFSRHGPHTPMIDCQAFEGQAAFMARLTALDIKFDLSLYGLWMMREAFEEECELGISIPAVRIAAQWIRYAGERMRKHAAEGKRYPGKLGVAKGKYSHRVWLGFNEARWQVWREELKAAQAQMEDDELIREAVEIMEKL